MPHDRNIKPFKAFVGLDGGNAIVQVTQRLRKSVGAFAARLHATRVVVGKHAVAVCAKLFDLLHIGAVTAAKAVIEHDESARDGILIRINISLQSVPHRGLEGIRLALEPCKIGGGIIEYGLGIVTTGVHHSLKSVYNLFFKNHNVLPSVGSPSQKASAIWRLLKIYMLLSLYFSSNE